jgi:hypothetical protein
LEKVIASTIKMPELLWQTVDEGIKGLEMLSWYTKAGKSTRWPCSAGGPRANEIKKH